MSRSDLFQGFVLAGGKSSRMGTDKAFLKIGEKTFVENAIDALKPNCRKVSVVLNKTQTDYIDKLPAETPYIFDIFENRGALGGIHSALTACETEFAFILACDMPLVSSAMIGELCSRAVDSERFSALVARQNDNIIQPLFAVYQKEECLKSIESILSQQQSASVRYFLNSVNTELVDEVEFNSKTSLFKNINTQYDLDSLFD